MDSSNNGLGFGLSFGLQDNFSSGAASIQNSFGQLQNGAERLANSVENSMGKIYQGFAQVGAGIALFLPIVKAINAFAEMDSLERGMIAIMGSAKLAKEEMIKLREVAKLPGLGVKEAIEGSINLQASGLSADLARRALMGFGAALATVGRGKAYLSGVNLALSQIMSKGKVSAQEINQLSERVPQMRKLMQAAFGTSDTEKLGKMGVSAEKFIVGIVNQLEKLEKPIGGIGNAFENLSDSLYLLLVAAGKPLAPYVERLANSVAELAVTVERFVATDLGARVVKIAASFLALVGSTIIVRGLTTALGGLLGVIGGFGVPLTKMFRTFNGTMTGMGLIFRGKMTEATTLFNRFSKALWAFATNPITLVVAGIAASIYLMYKAYQSFDNLLNGGKQLSGFAGILQKIGGILRGIGAIFSSVTDEGWSMSEELYLSLQKIGVLDTVRAIGTWIVRLRAMFKGFGQAIGESFSWVGNIFKETKDIIFAMLGPNLSLRIKKIVSDMGMFHNVGHFIGRIFGIIIKVVGVVISLIGLFVGLIVKATLVIYDFGVAAADAFQSAFSSVWDFVSSIPNILGQMWSFFKSLVGRAYYIGANFVNNLWDGIKSVWTKLTDWLSEKWNNLAGMFGGAFSFNDTTTKNDAYSPQSTTQAGTQILSSIAPGRVTTQSAPILSAMASQPKGGTSTVVSKEKLNDISINLLLDGHTLHRSTNNISAFDEARNGN